VTRRVLVATAVSIVCVLARPATAQQPGAPVAAPAATSDSTRMAAITYISGSSLYVNAGRADGVREGMVLDVVRGSGVIASIRAVFLSSHSSSCDVVSSTEPPAVGDSVRYHPAVEPIAVAAYDSNATRATERTRRRAWQRPVRGHAGIRYLRIAQPGIDGAATTQPSADVHIEATGLGGTPVGFVIDGRGRRTIGGLGTSIANGQTLVYEASMSLANDASGTRISAGRQYSAALSPVSLFDGITAEVNRARWAMGLFSGVQPDVATMSFSTAVREMGGYLQLHSEPASTVPWSMTAGGVESRDLGELNREFGFAQLTASGRFVTLYATQEVDVNRGWKRTAGEPAVSPTSSFATVQIRLADWLSLNSGVDNRRNVRLYRDFVSPETEFDDAFRQGMWGGANLTVIHRIRIGADARTNRGGAAGESSFYTGTFGIDPTTGLGLEARARSTRFRTDRTEGWLHSWSAGTSPWDIVRLEVNGGLRSQRLVAQGPTTGTVAPFTSLADTRWIGGSLDISVGRSWYILLSGTRDGTGVERVDQLYSSLVFRF
jgi:hypothetical protein